MAASTRPVPRPNASGWSGYAPLDAPVSIRFRAAANDLVDGVRRWRSWSYLAVEAVKNQYRRTVLGPWWLTLQTAVYVFGIAVIFGQILQQPLRSFLPYVAVGLITFNLLVGLTRAAANVFITAASTMKSTGQPLSGFVLRDVTIEFIQFGHNLLIYLLFLAVGLVPLSVKILVAVPIVAAIALNGLLTGLWLGVAVARFRDVAPFVNSVLQVLIFFTPVFYKLSALNHSARGALLGWNPFTYLLSGFRAPLIGAPLLPSYYIGTAIVTLANLVVAAVVFTRLRSHLPYWVA
jgi:ABC-type polysaccharide/polyol phosphate export permease